MWCRCGFACCFYGMLCDVHITYMSIHVLCLDMSPGVRVSEPVLWGLFGLQKCSKSTFMYVNVHTYVYICRGVWLHACIYLSMYCFYVCSCTCEHMWVHSCLPTCSMPWPSVCLPLLVACFLLDPGLWTHLCPHQVSGKAAAQHWDSPNVPPCLLGMQALPHLSLPDLGVPLC